jgi:hypothetical protein
VLCVLCGESSVTYFRRNNIKISVRIMLIRRLVARGK